MSKVDSMSFGIGLGAVLGVGCIFLLAEFLPIIALVTGGYLIVKSMSGGDK